MHVKTSTDVAFSNMGQNVWNGTKMAKNGKNEAGVEKEGLASHNCKCEQHTIGNCSVDSESNLVI